MKKKFFKFLLLGAFTLSLGAGFVGCKDYDDDITSLNEELAAMKADLQGKIDALNTTVGSIQTTVNGLPTTSAVNAAVAAAKAEAIAAAEAAVNALADGAVKANADNIAALLADVATIKEQLAAIDPDAITGKLAELTDATAANAAKLALQESVLAKYFEATAEVSAFEAAIAAIAEMKTKIGDLTAADFAALKELINQGGEPGLNLDWDPAGKMITKVDFHNEDIDLSTGDGLLWYGITKAKLTTTWGPTDTEVSFVKDQYTSMGDYVLVQVTPSDAVLSADQIRLVNSYVGTDNDALAAIVNDFFDVTVEKYDELLYAGRTRANESNGLWKVSYTLKTDADLVAFHEAIYKNADEDLMESDDTIYFALEVDNKVTAESSERYVLTPFTLTISAPLILPEYELDYYVNAGDPANMNDWKLATTYNNRYGLAISSATEEMRWKSATAYGTPVVDTGDDRHAADLLIVEADDDGIARFWTSLDLPTESLKKAQHPYAFYMETDIKYAYQSYPSEEVAWNTYKYEGLNQVNFWNATQEVVINDPSAVGDIIGFRMQAVNYTGEEVDPDGKAFYIGIIPSERNRVNNTTFQLKPSIDYNDGVTPQIPVTANMDFVTDTVAFDLKALLGGAGEFVNVDLTKTTFKMEFEAETAGTPFAIDETDLVFRKANNDAINVPFGGTMPIADHEAAKNAIKKLTLKDVKLFWMKSGTDYKGTLIFRNSEGLILKEFRGITLTKPAAEFKGVSYQAYMPDKVTDGKAPVYPTYLGGSWENPWKTSGDNLNALNVEAEYDVTDFFEKDAYLTYWSLEDQAAAGTQNYWFIPNQYTKKIQLPSSFIGDPTKALKAKVKFDFGYYEYYASSGAYNAGLAEHHKVEWTAGSPLTIEATNWLFGAQVTMNIVENPTANDLVTDVIWNTTGYATKILRAGQAEYIDVNLAFNFGGDKFTTGLAGLLAESTTDDNFRIVDVNGQPANWYKITYSTVSNVSHFIATAVNSNNPPRNGAVFYIEFSLKNEYGQIRWIRIPQEFKVRNAN